MKKNCYVLLAYFVLALFFWGFPMKFNFIGRVNISGDPAFCLWSLKWWPYAISHGINPFLTKAFWAPFGQNLAWTTSCPSIALIMYLFTKLFGPVFSYNLIIVISLTLSSYGIYLINKHLGLKESSSIFGGLIFFFSSYVWGQLLGHLNLDIVFVVVFLCYLYVLKFKNLIGRKTYIILFALLLAFQFGISKEIYATFIVFSFFAFIILLLLYAKEENNRIKLINMGFETVTGIAGSIVLLLPYVYYILYGYVSEQLNSNSIFVSDPVNYIIPTPITWFLGSMFLPISSKFSGNFSEEGAYLGLPLLFITISFIYMTIRNLHKQNKMYVFIVLIFLIAIVFSFGPYLRILNHKIMPMPWIIFSKLPFIKQALPARFTLYVDLVASIIAALWFEKFNKVAVKYIVGGFTILFLIPNLKVYSGDLINQYIPYFINSGNYKHYIKRGENIIVLPAYQAGGFCGPLWQYKTDFYFNLSQPIIFLSKPPQISWYMLNFFQPEGLNNKANLSGFAQYLKKCNVKYILVPESNKKLIKELDVCFAKKK